MRKTYVNLHTTSEHFLPNSNTGIKWLWREFLKKKCFKCSVKLQQDKNLHAKSEEWMFMLIWLYYFPLIWFTFSETNWSRVCSSFAWYVQISTCQNNTSRFFLSWSTLSLLEIFIFPFLNNDSFPVSFDAIRQKIFQGYSFYFVLHVYGLNSRNLVFHSSGGCDVEAYGPTGFRFWWELSPWFAHSCLLAVPTHSGKRTLFFHPFLCFLYILAFFFLHINHSILYTMSCFLLSTLTVTWSPFNIGTYGATSFLLTMLALHSLPCEYNMILAEQPSVEGQKLQILFFTWNYEWFQFHFYNFFII